MQETWVMFLSVVMSDKPPVISSSLAYGWQCTRNVSEGWGKFEDRICVKIEVEVEQSADAH